MVKSGAKKIPAAASAAARAAAAEYNHFVSSLIFIKYTSDPFEEQHNQLVDDAMASIKRGNSSLKGVLQHMVGCGIFRGA